MEIIEGHKLPLYSNYFNKLLNEKHESQKREKLQQWGSNWILVLRIGTSHTYAKIMGNRLIDKNTYENELIADFIEVDEINSKVAWIKYGEIPKSIQMATVKNRLLGALIL